jgi:hypothetical protein
VRTLHLVEFAPIEVADYTVDAELKQISAAAILAESQFRRTHPDCTFALRSDLKRGSEEELYEKISKIAAEAGKNVVVGLSRTNFARIAAKAAKGSTLSGISIGASAANLARSNPNFISIVSPLINQVEVVLSEFGRRKCDLRRSAGVFDSRQYLSSQYLRAFKDRGLKDLVDLAFVSPDWRISRLGVRDCVFIGLNFSDAQSYLKELVSVRVIKAVFGTGDWNFYSGELRKTLVSSGFSGKPKVLVPTGWISGLNASSEEFAKQIYAEKSGIDIPGPVAAYTYDAVMLALASFCDGVNFIRPDVKSFGRLKLLRIYSGVTGSGNYLSPISIVEFQPGLKGVGK